ncbi:MAG: thiamine pyrophosphate-dependent dehydrogenase E1 component subunit alpha [Bacteroidota bacterium]
MSKALYTKKYLQKLYEQMVLIRKTEESFVQPILDGTIRCPVHLYSGQEAVAVGISAHLNNKDIYFGNHRSHGHYLAKGGDLYRMVAEIYCKEDGCAKGRGGSMHILDPSVGMLGAAPIVSGTIALSLGAALALKGRKRNNLAVAFFGDGAMGEGVLIESINFAAVKNLPIIFVCENNLYSTHLPIREIRPNVPIAKIGSAYGILSYRVDGNDLLKTLDVSKKAVDLCRKGKGPVFIEFLTYRMRGHVGPSDNIQGTLTDIRPAKEIDLWKKKDPIKRFEKYLLSKKMFDKNTLKQIHQKIDAMLVEIHSRANAASRPNPKELPLYVFK